jgi:metal-responsive CopG/Arc/MetJ family transcriptional regulator
MARAKVAVSLDKRIFARLDRLVRAAVFANRSQAKPVRWAGRACSSSQRYIV